MPHITARSQGVATLVKLHKRLQSQLLLLFAIVMGRWPRHPEYELGCLWRLPVHQSSWGGWMRHWPVFQSSKKVARQINQKSRRLKKIHTEDLGRVKPVNECRLIHSVGTTNGVVRINPHDLFASQTLQVALIRRSWAVICVG